MALTNTPQQDYQSIITTTGKGFKQSILKKQAVISSGLSIPAGGGFITGITASKFFTSSGNAITLVEGGDLQIDVVFKADFSANGYVYLACLFYSPITLASIDDTRYTFVEAGDNKILRISFRAYRPLVVGEQAYSISLSSGSTIVSNVSVQSAVFTLF